MNESGKTNVCFALNERSFYTKQTRMFIEMRVCFYTKSVMVWTKLVCSYIRNC